MSARTKARNQFLTLFAADVVSVLGTRISMVAVPWLVLVTTGSPAKMGLVALAEMLPYVVSAVASAPLADRFGLRRATIVTDTVSAIAMALIAAVPQLGFGGLLVLIAIAGGMRGIGDRVKHVMLRPLAEQAGLEMIRVTSAYEGANRGAMLIGAPIGGLLIYAVGARGTIWIDAVSFALCALTVATLIRLPAGEGEPQAGERYLKALVGGFRYLWNDKLLLGMMAVIFVFNISVQASVAVFVPVWVNEVLHSPAALGLLFGSFALGGVLGNIGFTIAAPKLPRMTVFLIGAVLAGAPRMLAMGVSHHLWLVLPITFLSGLASASINPVLGATLYERVPKELQTRVFGVCASFGFLGVPIGGLLAGWGTSVFGLRTAILLLSALVLAGTAVPLWRLHRRTTEEEVVTA